MAGAISDIVDVSIERGTKKVSQRGFGIPLILGVNGVYTAERIREYSTILGVADDFLSTDEEYKAANAMFSQTPSPTTIKIGIKDGDVAQVQTLTFVAEFVAANVINMTIDNVAMAPVTWNATHDQTMTDLATAMQLAPGVATATVTGGAGSKVITVTAALAGVPVVITEILVTLGATQTTGVMATTVDNHGPVEDLNEISEFDDDWYMLVNTDRTAAIVLETAVAIEARVKMFITSSSAVAIYDAASTTDIAYLLSAANYERTIMLFNEDNDDWADAAWAGRVLPEDPGSATWKFKVLSGITASPLTQTQLTAVLNKECNVVTDYLGQSITHEGVVTEGEFIDIIRGTDWLRARIEESVYQLFVNEDKVPYTDAGVSQVKNRVEPMLQEGISNGLIAESPAPTVTAPLVADISSTNKANRYLPDTVFTATYAGAIHKNEIDGTVTA